MIRIAKPCPRKDTGQFLEKKNKRKKNYLGRMAPILSYQAVQKI